MTRTDRARYEMFSRVRQFGKTHGQRFSESSIGGKAFATVTAAVDALEQNAKAKVRNADDGQEARALARNAIVEQLREVARTAAASPVRRERAGRCWVAVPPAHGCCACCPCRA